MKKEYDFSKACKNPYAAQLNENITAGHAHALRADINQGLADVKAKRLNSLDLKSIKQQGRQQLKRSEK
jgi:hypothetical protein